MLRRFANCLNREPGEAAVGPNLHRWDLLKADA